MNSTSFVKIALTLGAVLCVSVMHAQQASNWRVYGTADGLAESGCRFVSVGGAGDVLIRGVKQSAIALFDGYSWTNLPAPDPKSLLGKGRVFESPAGQLWMAYSGGLCQLSDNGWVPRAIPEIAEMRGTQFMIQVVPVRQNDVLLLLTNELAEFSLENSQSYRIIRKADSTDIGAFSGLATALDDSVWISGEHGLAHIPGPRRAVTRQTLWSQFAPPPDLGVTSLSGPQCNFDGSVTCLAKRSGVTIILRFDGAQWTSLAAPVGVHFAWVGPDSALWAATSDSLLRATDGKFVPDDNLALGTIYDATTDPRGMIWLATSEGLFCQISKLWRTDSSPPPNLFADTPPRLPSTLPPDTATNDVVATITMPDGETWCATHDAVWSFNGRGWANVRSGMGRINTMIQAADGPWIASSLGVHHFTQGNWIDMATDEGLGSPMIRNIAVGVSGQVRAQSGHGIDIYSPASDIDPPRVEISPASRANLVFRAGTSVNMNWSGRDKWNFTPAGRLLYSWRMDDLDWSTFDAAMTVVFAQLAPGGHYFQVRAMDRNGNVTPRPAWFEFSVVLPWYREARVVWIGVAGAGAALFFAGLAFKRHRELVHSYALVEQQIVERTRELQLANEELLQSQKMKALGTLSAGIAHDFNNILSIIKGSVQIIEDNPGDAKKISTRTSRIKTVVDQGSAVVQALLGFSRSSDESSEPCAINPVVENTIRLFGDRFLREIKVQFDHGEGLPDVCVPKTLVQQILLNFVFNAAESMTGTKEVVITTSESPELPTGMALQPERAGGYVLVTVKDSGCGIPPENIGRVFEPFFTTKAFSARRGTGLGLSVAYELARKMKAGLAVQSAVGQGSVFILILPIAETPSSVSNKS